MTANGRLCDRHHTWLLPGDACVECDDEREHYWTDPRGEDE